MWTQFPSLLTVTWSCHLMYHMSANLLSLPFRCICEHLWHPANTDLQIAKLFNNCHYTAFTSGLGGAHLSMVMWRLLHISLSTRCMLSDLTALQGLLLQPAVAATTTTSTAAATTNNNVSNYYFSSYSNRLRNWCQYFTRILLLVGNQ